MPAGMACQQGQFAAERFTVAAMVALTAPLLVLTTMTALAGASASGCYDFSYDEPANEAGAGDTSTPVPDGESGTCVADGSYCGGDRVVGEADTIYRCAADGGGLLLRKCAGGCARDGGGGEGARCNLPDVPCQAGGNYCGGDKLDGDPRILYRCVANGAHTILERCTKGCRVMPEGSDDDCAP